jgi:hypothetical protein
VPLQANLTFTTCRKNIENSFPPPEIDISSMELLTQAIGPLMKALVPVTFNGEL